MKDSTKRIRYRGIRSRKAALMRARQAKAQLKAQAQATPEPQPEPTPQDTTIPIRESASKRKLNLYAEAEPSPVQSQQTQGQYAIVDLGLLAGIVTKLSCTSCGHSLTLSWSVHQGFAIPITIACAHCSCEESSSSSGMTSATVESGRHYDVNRRMVAAFLNIGLGHAALSSFCETMGMPVMEERTFRSHMMTIAVKCDSDIKSDTLASATRKMKEHHNAPDTGPLDVAVCFDGTWHKRGHTSKHGFASVIEVETGLVLDYHVMSIYCHLCKTVGVAKKNEGDAAYKTWLSSHQCSINHEGTSGMMEVEAARVMWARSLDKGLRFVTMISDGDSKTYSELKKMSPYNVPVQKEECTNHVAKRLGTKLRDLCQTQSKKGNTLGGRKPGSLTQTKMNLLQGFYKKCVSSKCSSVEELRRKIFTTLNHAASMDENPMHDTCPTGPDSWCWYNKAVALGTTPPPHRGQSSIELSPHVEKFVRPIYEGLTSDALLQRCLKGLTQNANESLHSVIWARCPKHLFVGQPRVKIASAIGVGQFNSGATSYRSFLRHIGLTVTSITFSLGRARDFRRIIAAERKETNEAKRRRKERALAVSKARRELERMEGGPSYAAGSF